MDWDSVFGSFSFSCITLVEEEEKGGLENSFCCFSDLQKTSIVHDYDEKLNHSQVPTPKLQAFEETNVEK